MDRGRLSPKFQLNHFSGTQTIYFFVPIEILPVSSDIPFMCVPERQTGIATLEITLDNLEM